MTRPTFLAPRPGEFFTWREFCTTDEDGFTPEGLLDDLAADPEAQCAIVALCAAVLDPLRRHAGPIRITSGYRTPALNRAINGSKTSDHMRGMAADIKLVSGHDAGRLLELARDIGIPTDQVIVYAIERGGHVHISHRLAETQRAQLLYAPRGGGYRPWTPGYPEPEE